MNTYINNTRPRRLRYRRVVAMALGGLLCVSATAWTLQGYRARGPERPSQHLAILSTPNNGAETFLHIVEIGQEFPPPSAVLEHLPDAAVQGAVLPNGDVLVIADYQPGRDRSFGSALFRLVPAGESVLLCDRVAFASRPLVAPDGKVFVQRGSAGASVHQGAMRVDSLSIDEVNPSTGAVRTLWQSTGYIAYIAGIFQGNLVVYHMQPSGARLVLVDRETGMEKVVLSSLPPFASDFSVTNKGDLVFQNRDERQTNLWSVERLNLSSGERERVYESRRPMAPRSWPHGEVVWNGSKGLRSVKSTFSASTSTRLVDIRAFTIDGMAAAAFGFEPSRPAPDLIILNSAGVEISRIVVPIKTRLDIAGFLP